jgi:hypothetical protein
MARHGSRYVYRVFSITLGLAFSLPATADCVPQPSTLDRAFGAVELGADATELPGDRDTWVTEQCIGVGDVQRDCTFLRAGITYEDYGRGVDFKRLSVHAWNADALPFGLSKFDKVDAVIKKTAPYLKRKLAVEKENGKVANLSSDFCYANSRGKIFSISFNFTNTGQLDSIVTYTKDFHSTDETQ